MEEMFNVDEQNQVMVQMMKVEDRFHTYYDQQISTWVLRLPFNNLYSMLLMLPDRGRGLAELEQHICPTPYAKWLEGLKKENETWYISLPKFSIKTNVNLNGVLRQMGITDVFGAAADLSGIAENVVVSKVVQQATLDVYESGATATAVTIMELMATSCLFIPPKLKFDRPFMVLIADPSDNILFLGKILNPNL